MITAKTTAFIAALAATACLLSTPVARAEGSALQGETLAYTCMGCHGIAGYRNAYPSYRVPKLGGQKAAYIESALRAYREGSRPHPTMQAQGTSLSDQDIEDLAAHFQGEEMVTDSATAESVADIDAARTCLACHGAESAGVVPAPPTLAGQHQDYIEHALRQYKNGARGGTVMSAFASSLEEDDIERIARFYSRQDGLTTPRESN